MNHLFQTRMTTTMGRGIFALKDIPQQKKILDIDECTYITYSRSAEHSFFGLLTLHQQVIDKKAHFAFYMAFVEKYKKRQIIHSGPLVKYMSQLPRFLHSLILWSESELQALKNKKLVQQAKHKRQDLQEKFRKIQKFLVNNKDQIFIPNYQSEGFWGFQEKDYFIHEYKYESKSEYNQGAMNSTSESEEPSQDQSGQSENSQVQQIEFNEYKRLCANIIFDRFLHFYCAIESRNIYHLNSWDPKSQIGALISVLELFNHSPNGQIEKKMYHLQTLANIQKGQQIFIKYGQYNNQELLFTYGCVIDDFFEKTKNDYVDDRAENQSWYYDKQPNLLQNITKQRLELAQRYNKLHLKDIIGSNKN